MRSKYQLMIQFHVLLPDCQVTLVNKGNYYLFHREALRVDRLYIAQHCSCLLFFIFHQKEALNILKFSILPLSRYANFCNFSLS